MEVLIQALSFILQVHDAYIELADLLVKTDPLAAVDVYSRFPLRPVVEQTFDDAFITGEIVRILMKQEMFDHLLLGPNLIAYGKVMGLGESPKSHVRKRWQLKTCILRMCECMYTL